MSSHKRNRKHSSSRPVPTPLCALFERLVPLLSGGGLDVDEEISVRAHLAECAWCQALLASYEVVDDALREHLTPKPDEPPVITVDDIVGTAWRLDLALEDPRDDVPTSERDLDVERHERSDVAPDSTPMRGELPSAPGSPWLSRSGAPEQDRRHDSTPIVRLPTGAPEGTMVRSLHVPDDPAWHLDAKYSPAVARALVRAYAVLRSGPRDVAHYQSARAYVATCLRYPMMPSQYLRVLYVLALAHAAAEDTTQAIAHLDDALDLAVRLADTGALIELFYLRGALNGKRWHYRAAADDQDACLSLLRDLGPAADAYRAPDTAFTLDVLLDLAASEFMVTHYDQSSRHLDEARPLVGQVPNHQRQAATFEWLNALLLRWRGEPERALGPAMAAADVIAGLHAPESTARIQSIVAEIALDIAETFPAGGSYQGREALLTLAEPYAHSAATLASESGNVSVEGIALIAKCRWQRLRQPDTNVIPIIESVRRAAQQHDDLPLLVQSITALGRELEIQGDHTGALQCYRQALDMVGKSQVSALGVVARRALHLAREMRPDDG
jgi:tetratricopeptide (TPR) repeat protein